MEKEIKQRAWSQLSNEAFTKIQDLQAVIATNKETMVALDESIRVHQAGLELLVGEKVEQIAIQFKAIIENFKKSYENLERYNEDAQALLDGLKTETDEKVLMYIEAFLRIVAFK